MKRIRHHAHHNMRTTRKRERVHATQPIRSSNLAQKSPESPPAAVQDAILKVLGRVVSDLEKMRDSHKTELDVLILQLDQVVKLGVKAAESSQTIAPKQRGPHTVGGFLVV